MFKIIHKKVEKITIRFEDQLRRYNYVTPTSYLELITMFKTILQEKKQEVFLAITRLRSGLDKLNDANKSVTEMKINLKKKEPELQKASTDTEKLMKHLTVEKADAEKTQAIV